MQAWSRALPGPTIRSKVTLMEAIDRGLTCHMTFVKALKKHPNFPWLKVRRMYPHHFDAATNEVSIVGNNRFYGFRSDLGDARSTLYKYVSYITKEFVVCTGDNLRLKGYRGFGQQPPKL